MAHYVLYDTTTPLRTDQTPNPNHLPFSVDAPGIYNRQYPIPAHSTTRSSSPYGHSSKGYGEVKKPASGSDISARQRPHDKYALPVPNQLHRAYRQPRQTETFPCLFSACRAPLFTRVHDLARHTHTVHLPRYTDCPYRRCERTGENGFSRKDHLHEHMRRMHGVL